MSQSENQTTQITGVHATVPAGANPKKVRETILHVLTSIDFTDMKDEPPPSMRHQRREDQNVED